MRQPDRFAAWLHRTTVNEAIRAIRRRTRRERATADLRTRSVPVETSKPVDDLVAADEAQRLSAALIRLEPHERSLFVLRFDKGLTFAEIAAALGEPGSTIKARTVRLVARLRAMLDVDAPAR